MVEVDIANILPIVVGAHLRAEQADRPAAYALRDRVNAWLDAHPPDDPKDRLEPVVCSDLWYLNHDPMHARPTISIGGPTVNALSAYLFPRLANALAVDNRLAIQMDVDLGDLRVNIWGADAEHTASAVELFERKYLDNYLAAAANGHA